MKRYSPVDFYELMPKIPYYFVYGKSDAYFTENHMPQLIERMEKKKFSYELRIEEGMNHCDIESHPGAFMEYCKFIIDLV
jgi:pimeloyl-ACP methyl ester carboxylesterase